MARCASPAVVPPWQVSSLVASEWYMRNNQFPGWARPYEFAAELLVQVGKREEEARDMARSGVWAAWGLDAKWVWSNALTGC